MVRPQPSTSNLTINDHGTGYYYPRLIDDVLTVHTPLYLRKCEGRVNQR